MKSLLQFVDQISVGQLVEKVENEGLEIDGKNFKFSDILLLKIREGHLIFCQDSFMLLPSQGSLFDIIDLQFSLAHNSQ